MSEQRRDPQSKMSEQGEQGEARFEHLDEHGKLNKRTLSALRGMMFKDLRQMALTWGAESLDLARAHYPNPNQSIPPSVEDKVYLPKARCSAVELMESVAQHWWPSRARLDRAALREGAEGASSPLIEGEGELEALCGFYGRYLSASGYHMVLEFTPGEGLTHVWRVDARARGVAIKLPKDEDDFYDQMGAFLDLHYGWRWQLHKFFQNHKRLTVIEAQHNYMLGIREGDPSSTEDPAEREDDELMDAFSRFDMERFDTLEFLNSDVADLYPFEGERCYDWLPQEYVEPLRKREVELFVLAVSEDFSRAVEEMAEVRHVEVEVSEKEPDNPLITLHRGPISISRPLSLPYLWTLHSGRSFAEGAIEFFKEDAERVSEAAELYFAINQRLSKLPSHHLSVDAESQDLSIAEGEEIKATLPLLSWGGMGAFEGPEGAVRALTLLGFSEEADPHSGSHWSRPHHPLDRCPLCGEEAHLKRAVRPERFKPERPLEVSFEHPQEGLWGYFTLSCAHHALPVTWSSAPQLEEALKAQVYHRFEVQAEVHEAGVTLLWADELAGFLLNPQGRESLRERGALFAYAFYPDLVGLSMLPLEGEALDGARERAELLAQRMSPARQWALNWSVALK